MEIMQNMNLTNQDTNFLQAYLNHLSEEQRKAFVATYMYILNVGNGDAQFCLLYTSPSPRDATLSRMPSSA